MKRLRPAPLKQKYYTPIEKEIGRILNELVYKKLFATLPKEIKNAVGDALYQAIENGEVWYENGLLRGSFNSKTGRVILSFGGKFNKKSKTYSVKDLPKEYITASVVAQGRYDRIRADMVSVLDSVNVDDIYEISNIPDEYVKSIDEINKDFVKVTRQYAIPPKLTQEAANTLAAEWSYNLDYYIRKWTDENISKMRNEIQSNIFGGQRIGNLAKVIEKNYAQSRNKAKFLARQETSLLMSKYHETRYKDLGITKYIWETSHDERVRHSHKELNGKVISWDNPPVVDPLTGRTAHAGEDFNCRCVAIAVID